MRTFKEFNPGAGHQCPICGKGTIEETVLIVIEGTQEGNNAQAAQVHTKCLQDGLRLMEPAPGVKGKGFIIAQCDYPSKNETAEETKDEHS